MIVREAVRADDAALLRIESASSQGDKLGLAEDRFSFFHRADRFERSIVLVGENERTGALLGVMAASIVRVRIRGEYRTAAYMFDLRNNPDASGGLSKALFVIWKHLERRLKDEGVELLFGYVKKDNSRSLSIVQRMGATSRGMVSHFTIPVLPPQGRARHHQRRSPHRRRRLPLLPGPAPRRPRPVAPHRRQRPPTVGVRPQCARLDNVR